MDNKLIKVLSESQMEDLLRLAKKEKSKALEIFAVIFYTGMIRREIRRLRKQDLDLQNDVIDIPYGKRKRKIPLHPNLKKILLAYLSQTQNKHYLFYANNEKEINNYLEELKNFLTKHGLEHLSIDSIRKAHVYMMCEKGMDVEAISKVVGHSDGIKTRVKSYSTILDKYADKIR